ncbi:MAG: barstar family protein [Saprospiraceae bacterium]
MNKYQNIEIIDFENIDTVEKLHVTFKSKLNFPEYYGNNFDALWDMFTSGFIPSNLFFYNSAKFSKYNKTASSKLRNIRVAFNKQSNFEIILNDYIRESDLSNLFADEPFQFGLRGDKELWKELENKYSQFKWNDESHIFIELKTEIERLLESNIDESKMIFIKRFAKGGMSSGKISTNYWLRIGIPTLMARFRKLQKAENT